jgi:hypothetical protein
MVRRREVEELSDPKAAPLGLKFFRELKSQKPQQSCRTPNGSLATLGGEATCISNFGADQKSAVARRVQFLPFALEISSTSFT